MREENRREIMGEGRKRRGKGKRCEKDRWIVKYIDKERERKRKE